MTTQEHAENTLALTNRVLLVETKSNRFSRSKSCLINVILCAVVFFFGELLKLLYKQMYINRVLFGGATLQTRSQAFILQNINERIALCKSRKMNL